MAETAILERKAAVRHGRRLEFFTIGWNALEGLVAVVAGAIAGSISLVGFGIDSFIEVTSGSVLLWRMSVDAEVHRRELNEKQAVKIVGVCFLLLAAYIAYESALDLWSRRVHGHCGQAISKLEPKEGACPACVQENLLRILLDKGDAALHEAAQTIWPLDAEAAF